MGTWNISIRGTGAHHNLDHDGDANRMASAFVRDLRAAGHTIHDASFVYGGAEDVSARFAGTSAGEVAFNAYRVARGGKNHDGTPTPTWDQVGDGVRAGWEAAAAAVIG